jgi:DNA-directed RNA polymerase specialized sigma24 family protein
VVWLYYFRGLTTKQIALALGEKPDTITARRYRALDQLRKTVRKDFEGC